MIVITRLPPKADKDGVNIALALRRVLIALAECDSEALGAFPLPPLYSTRIRYQPEEQAGTGIERFDDPWEVYARGHGDCDDLIRYRCAELFHAGERPGVNTIWLPAQGRYHVRVRRASGALEDPSKVMLKKNG